MKYPRTINGKQTKEYTAFAAMRGRILQDMPSWRERYRGSIYDGMELQEEWHSREGYDDFREYMGEAPEGTLLDRIDNEKGYIKGNLRWADKSTSNKNKSNANMITAFGITKNLSDWAKEYNQTDECLHRRIFKYNMSPEEALTKPLGKNSGKYKDV